MKRMERRLPMTSLSSKWGLLRVGSEPAGADKAEEVVAAVLDHRGAGIAHELLDRKFLREPVAPENLQRLAGDFERGVGRVDFRGDRILEEGRVRGVVVRHPPGERPRRLYLDKHLEQAGLH